MGKIITLNVDGHYISVSDRVLGATGASAATTLRIIFDSSWGETSKRVYFTDARGRVPVSMLLTTNMLVLPDDDFADDTSDIYEVPVPAEVLSYPGTAEVTVQGVFDEDGDGTAEKVMQTASARFTVLDGSVPCGMPSQKPTVDEAMQLQGEIDAIKADIVKAAQAAAAVEDASEAAREAERHAAKARAVMSVLSSSGVGVDISAMAIPVKWYDGEHTALHDKLFVLRTDAAAVMTLSLDEDPEPEEPAPIEGDDGDGGELPGDDPNPGVPIYPTVYSGLVSGWLSDGTLYLSKNKVTGELSVPFAETGLYLGLDYGTMEYRDIQSGEVWAGAIEEISGQTIVVPEQGKIYQIEDGTTYIWTGTEYLPIDLSAMQGDGMSLLERILALQAQLNAIASALEEVV